MVISISQPHFRMGSTSVRVGSSIFGARLYAAAGDGSDISTKLEQERLPSTTIRVRQKCKPTQLATLIWIRSAPVGPYPYEFVIEFNLLTGHICPLK